MNLPPPPDEAVGMGIYASQAPPCSARIKAKPEDFRVEEDLAGIAAVREYSDGLLPLYRIEKRLIDTPHLEREMSESLKSRVSFAGMKDKKAVAVQYATPTSTRGERPASVVGASFRADLVGYVERPVSRGMIHGNRFRVVLRDCCPDISGAAKEAFRLADERRLPNFYGLQRFGGRGVLTHRVGRAMVRQKFEEAVRTLLCEPRPSDDPRAGAAREAMSSGRYAEGSRLLPDGQDIEKAVARRMADDPGTRRGPSGRFQSGSGGSTRRPTSPTSSTGPSALP